jgi:hypothetical protein
MNSALYDFATDLNSLPLVAFVSPDGIFLATGDALGVEQREPPAREEPLRLPTVVRGILEVPSENQDSPGSSRMGIRSHNSVVLLDISGRKVLDLQPGANNVGGLAPGIYFVRSEIDRGAPIRIVKLK